MRTGTGTSLSDTGREATRITTTLAYAAGMAAEARGGVTSLEAFTASLTTGAVTGRPLALAAAAQDLYTQLAATFHQLHAELERHLVIAEAYAATGNDAGSKEFTLGDTDTSGDAGDRGGRAGWARSGPRVAVRMLPPSGDPVAAARALAEAYRRGHTVERALPGGQNSELVQVVRLSDGTPAVHKKVNLAASENPDEVQDAYLAGLVAHALGITDATTVALGKDELLSVFAPGIPGKEQVKRAGARAVEALADTPINPVERMYVERDARTAASHQEFQRILHLRHAREIGLLDYITGNLDRNHRNYLVDEDTVHPIDQGFCYFRPMTWESDHEHELNSPFSQQHLHPTLDVRDDNRAGPPKVSASALISPFSTQEMTQFRQRLESLRPEFAAHQATAKWWFMMSRFAVIERTARQRRIELRN